ncbi:MAG: hypothetical protein ACRCX8_14475 [Sarcina sp.]
MSDKIKVGTKVRIKESLFEIEDLIMMENPEHYDNAFVGVNHYMTGYEGMEAVVENIDDNGSFSLDVDGGHWAWEASLVEVIE